MYGITTAFESAQGRGCCHKHIWGRVLIMLALASSVASGDECREYSQFTCKQIEAAEYNVLFSPPRGDAARIGRASGLSECGNMARSYAANMNMSRADWGYVCCMIAKGSDCYEKHR
jgi:hypothetical protein